VDVKNVASIIKALATSDEFAVSDYFDHKSNSIATPSRPLPLTQISSAGSAQVSMLLFVADWGVFSEVLYLKLLF
jgi:hypothetical protein